MQLRWLVPCLAFAAACGDDSTPQASSTFRLGAAAGAEAAGTITVTVQRLGEVRTAATVNYSTSNGTATAGADFTTAAGTLSWAAGDGKPQTFTVAVLDDLAIEGEERFSVALTDPGGGSLGAPVMIAIRDDDRVGDAIAVTSAGRIVSVDSATPATLRHAAPVSGLQNGESIVGMDFRPRDSKLYALTNRARLVTIAPDTGVATVVVNALVRDPSDASDPFAALAGTAFGIDFNPVADRLRVVSDTGQNLRIDVDTGRTFTDDTIRGATTGLVAAGYDNNFAAACRTRLFAIDIASDRLVLQDPPNNGTTTAIGAGLGVDATAALLDIAVGPTGATSAVAVLTVGGTLRPYVISLTTGVATAAGTLSLANGESLRGLALQSVPASVTIAQAPGELIGVTASERVITFNRGAPGKPCTSAPITGIDAADEIVGIDVRPLNGRLYALTRDGSVAAGAEADGTLYIVDPATGVATSPVTLSQKLAGTEFGVDFNPIGGVALRIVSDTGRNLRVTNVEDGTTAADMPLTIGGTATGAAAAAYTNAVQGTGVTTLYTIDPTTDRLRIQSPPNDGIQQDRPAGLGVDVASLEGFEIDGRDNTALAAVRIAGAASTTLHTIDLTSGTLSASLGAFAGGERLLGLARPSPVTTVFGLIAPNQLVTISLANAAPTVVGTVTGLANGEALLGIDFRPSTGILYGLGSLGGLYSIDPATAAATRVIGLSADATDTSAPFSALSGNEFGLDFNPTGVVALRVVSDAEQNLRIPNVLTGAAFTDTTLVQPEGTPAPDAVAAAYSNSFPGTLATTLYVIDVATNQLMIQAPPNDGVLRAVNLPLSATLRFTGRAAFDIAGGENGIAIAALQTANADGTAAETFSRLYRIDLATGAATAITGGGAIGAGAALRGLAIRVR